MKADKNNFDKNVLKFFTGQLSAREIPYDTDADLSRYTSFRCGGKAALMIRPQNSEQTLFIQSLLHDTNIAYFYLSGGSNVLFSDEGFCGAIIHAEYSDRLDISEKDNMALVNASHSSASFSRKMAQLGYAGFEFLSTIPGQLGGALVQNAGCYGSEMKDVVHSAFVSKGRPSVWLKNADLEFEYRSSLFKKESNWFIHAICFNLVKGDAAEIEQKMEEYKQKRMQSQPKNRRSAGSIFKNPPGLKAWQLIADCSLQGKRMGGAQISTEHANFIVNEGEATSSDILALIKLVRNEVENRTGIRLETEVVLVPSYCKENAQ